MLLLRLHILRRAAFYKKEITGDIKQKLKRASDISFTGNTRIIFTWALDGASVHPDAMSVVPGLIAVNAEWAARLVLFDEPEVWNAFRYTIGHEMTHQSGDYSYLEAFTRKKRFVNWVCEVHADYGGAVYAFDGDLNNALSAIGYKARDYRNDKDHQGHPSWKRRQDYLKCGCFDEKLILQIAEDAGCRNSILIDNVCKHYKPIVLSK